MTTAITRDGDFAFKAFANQSASTIGKLVRLTGSLRASGVPVPETRKDPLSNGIILPWIEGETMRDRFKARGSNNFAGAAEDLRSAMSVLRRLHGSDVPKSGLEQLRPFKNCDSRVSDPAFKSLPCHIRLGAKRLRILIEMQMPMGQSTRIVHGDFHPGQLILEEATGKWWLIDLDDAAFGHCESDIANFCVNIATHSHQSTGRMLACFDELAATCLPAYGAKTDRHQLNIFAATTFLRRALKFAARGDDLARVSDMLAAGTALASDGVNSPT